MGLLSNLEYIFDDERDQQRSVSQHSHYNRFNQLYEDAKLKYHKLQELQIQQKLENNRKEIE